MATNQLEPLILRVNVKSVATGILRLGEPGIICVGVPAVQDFPGLILIHDERELNDGASATNGCDRVLSYIDKHWAGAMAVREANVVECDSDGMYDHLHVTWGKSWRPEVGWTPARWAGEVPRTEGAFRGLFGVQARRALQALAEFQARHT